MKVLVVGGGCVGLCCAIALAERGVGVRVFERGLPGGANTIMTGGGVRQQFGSATNIRLSQLAQLSWDSFSTRYGVDPRFRATGYLFLASSLETVGAVRAQVALQQRLDVDSLALTNGDIAERWPVLAGRGFLAGGYRAGDGWLNHFRVVDGLTRGALALGVEIQTGTDTLHLRTRADRVVGATTSDGDVDADAVVLATGPWASELTRGLGIGVPVTGRRHELALVDPGRPLPSGMPWLIGLDQQVHLRSDAAGRVLIGGFLGADEEVDVDNYSTRAGSEWIQRTLAVIDDTFGLLGPGTVPIRSWAGLYPSTPDHHPIIDELAPGLYGALGFSGTGLMHSPAAGQLVSELILGGEIISMNAEPLAADRFEGTALYAETTGF